MDAAKYVNLRLVDRFHENWQCTTRNIKYFLANVDYEDSDYDVLVKLGCEALEEKLQQLSFE